MKMCGNRPGPGDLRDFNRRDLAAAKKRLSGFTVVMLLEHYAEGLLAFCTVWKSTSALRRCRVDGVEVDAAIQHERAVKF